MSIIPLHVRGEGSVPRRINYCSICTDPITREKVPLKGHKCPYADMKGKRRMAIIDRNPKRARLAPSSEVLTVPDIGSSHATATMLQQVPMAYEGSDVAPAVSTTDSVIPSFSGNLSLDDILRFYDTPFGSLSPVSDTPPASSSPLLETLQANDDTPIFNTLPNDNAPIFDSPPNEISTTAYIIPNDITPISDVTSNDFALASDLLPDSFTLALDTFSNNLTSDSLLTSIPLISDTLPNDSSHRVATSLPEEWDFQFPSDDVVVDVEAVEALLGGIGSGRSAEDVAEPSVDTCDRMELDRDALPLSDSSSSEDSDSEVTSSKKSKQKAKPEYLTNEGACTRCHSKQAISLRKKLEILGVKTGSYIFCYISRPETVTNRNGTTTLVCTPAMANMFAAEGHPEYPQEFHKRVIEYEESRRSDQKAVVELNAKILAQQTALQSAEEICIQAEEALQRANVEIARLRAQFAHPNQNMTTST
ncbi:hypothetical protein QCA50_011681 [Cerrena zonata]|uniref:Uncharacterized protein n=1 Tax=Cerrena zonata TaxID=2478898 RepID=A0AAW0FW76_9APHY